MGGSVLLLLLRQSPRFLLTRVSSDGFSLTYGFLIALLQAAWTFTGYDASAHATEETVDPPPNPPRGIVLSVAVSAVFGWVMLVAVTLAIPCTPEGVLFAVEAARALKAKVD